MAIIKNIQTKEIYFLNSIHSLGSNIHKADTFIEGKDISTHHATIYWENGYWYIIDHSKSGTLLNANPIRKETRKLQNQQVIQFGKEDRNKWEIVNLLPPSSYLKSLSHKNKMLELRSCHTLPNDDNNMILFYLSAEEKWTWKNNDRYFLLHNRQTIKFNNEEWQFIENEIIQQTPHQLSATKAFFKFHLSINEEHISLKVIIDQMEIDLGSHSHNYLLLSLARKRLEDMNKNYDLYDQGWVTIDQLTYDVGKEMIKEVDVYYLNLQIHRIKKQFSKLKNYGMLFTNVIERRKGEIRFAYPYFQLVKDKEVSNATFSI